MAQMVEAVSGGLTLDKAFQYAVTLAWDDLMKPVELRSIRVEYVCAPGAVLDHLSVWAVRAGGYQNLVCDCWSRASLAHSGGALFADQYRSDKLAGALGLVLENQDQFTRFADASRFGLVQIYPPDAGDRREASSWMTTIQEAGREQGAGEAPALPEERRHQEEALSRMDDEGYFSESEAALPDATGYSDYEWSPT